MVVREYEAWPDGSRVWGREVVPGQPWIPSPEAPLFALPDVETETSVIPRINPRRAQKRKARKQWDPFHVKKSLKSLFRKGNSSVSDALAEDVEKWPALGVEYRRVTPADFRAYGYWARPLVYGKPVRNSTPPPVSRKLSPHQVELVFQNLKDSDGNVHPENWIARIEHPSLPPRPSLWPTPPPSPRQSISLPSDQLQLNPFLQHRATGKTPIFFDVRHNADMIRLGELTPVKGDKQPIRLPFEIDHSNGAQPATYPGVSSLKITTIADDPLPICPWPILVVSHHPSLPVLVGDVLYAIIRNFSQHMTNQEYYSLTLDRRLQVHTAYWNRVRVILGDWKDDDGVRRIDYLGDRHYFRGLEPDSNGEGFVIFFGQL